MDQKIKLQTLDAAADEIMDQLGSNWGTFIKIEELPLGFDRAAVSNILKESNRIALRLFKKAVGAAYINEHYYVKLEDSELAIQIFNAGDDLQEQLNRYQNM